MIATGANFFPIHLPETRMNDDMLPLSAEDEKETRWEFLRRAIDEETHWVIATDRRDIGERMGRSVLGLAARYPGVDISRVTSVSVVDPVTCDRLTIYVFTQLKQSMSEPLFHLAVHSLQPGARPVTPGRDLICISENNHDRIQAIITAIGMGALTLPTPVENN